MTTVPTQFWDAEADLSTQITMASIHQAERFNAKKPRELVDARQILLVKRMRAIVEAKILTRGYWTFYINSMCSLD
jgi:hypothetical protein